MIVGKLAIGMPARVKCDTYAFEINSDDMPCVRAFNQWLRDKGIRFKYSRKYSQTKLMSWGVWKIDYLSANQPLITDFEQNREFVRTLLAEYEGIA